MSEFTKRVKELMERDQISQKELAKLSGISESSISRYLSGSKEPRMDILANIAKVFNVTTSYLVGEENCAPQFFDAYEETLAECLVSLFGDGAEEGVDADKPSTEEEGTADNSTLTDSELIEKAVTAYNNAERYFGI